VGLEAIVLLLLLLFRFAQCYNSMTAAAMAPAQTACYRMLQQLWQQ
jgi:hypothetical protein